MKASSAFSLVELSIVLVILGLLVGGVLSGQSLIKAAELRAVTTQFAGYRTATYSFRDKYFAMPGDMNNATAFWGSAGGTGNNVACFNAQTNTSIATCNGDGDGNIMGTPLNVERFAAWKHLANAGLVEGSYTGASTAGAGTYNMLVPSTNPGSKNNSGFFDLSFMVPDPTYWFSASRTTGNVIILYGYGSPGAIDPQSAWNIDTKFDDGSPVNGAYFSAIKSSTVGGNCSSSDTATATYDFTVTSKNCILVTKL